LGERALRQKNRKYKVFEVGTEWKPLQLEHCEQEERVGYAVREGNRDQVT